jgi:hypothetical protein
MESGMMTGWTNKWDGKEKWEKGGKDIKLWKNGRIGVKEMF